MEPTNSGPTAGGEIGSRIGVRFYRYRAIVKRHWWILLLCVGLGLTYEAWVLLTKPTRFVSIGKLSVRETANDDAVVSRVTDSSWFGTITKTIESPAVHERVVKNVIIAKPESEGMVSSVEVTAENEPSTYFFAVKGSGPNPEFTQFFVNRVMDAFMEMRRDESMDSMKQRVQQLTQQNEKEKADMDRAQQAVDKFKEDNEVPFMETQAQQIDSTLAGLKKEHDELEQQINTYKNLDNGGLLKGSGAPVKRDNARDGESGGEQWIDKQQQLAMKEGEMKERSLVWQPAHPRYQLLRDEIEKLKIAINVLKEEAGKGREAALAMLRANLESKDKAMLEFQEKARSFTKIITKFNGLKAEVDRAEALFKHTREMLDKIVLTQGAPEILSIQQKATLPLKENRGVVKGILTGLIAGLLLGLAVLFMLDRNDDRLASSSEMIEQFSEPILAQIPDVASSRTESGLALLHSEDDRFMYAEAFRSLRSSLIFMPNQSELKTLIITSAIPNEGKSTIACNLAITMANAGARVLLVDADLRRGDVAALFDIDGRQGLSNILRGEVPWRNCIQTKEACPTLSVVPRGPVTNQSGELLLLPIVGKLLEEWKANFDLVIFNTAPILATDDTPTLAPNFDGTLMVIRASFTSARLTRNALNSLYQRQVNVLGLIMNCVDTELPDYYYYRYPKYYAA